jgi:hydrogenase/urease accessory protein HupE
VFALHRRLAKAALVAAFVLLIPRGVAAHDPGLSALEIRVEDAQITATLSLAAPDAQLARKLGPFERFALESIQLSLDDVRLAGAVERISDRGAAGASLVVRFVRVTGSRLTIQSHVPRRLARGHRELLTIRSSTSDAIVERMLDAAPGAVTIDLADEAQRPGLARRWFALGLQHILTGYDHLLFVAALLFGVAGLRSAVRTVTAFTAAHSLTLSLAVLGVARVPAGLVEPLIAASIVWVGIENLLRGQMQSRWKLTFAFGLVHGFGFAGALQDLGVGSGGGGVALPLACFNLGVEAGQIAVVMILWPPVRQLNARPRLRLRISPACSMLVVAAGVYWVLVRTLL